VVNPIYYLHIWEGRDELIFKLIDRYEFASVERHAEDVSIFNFKGQKANVFVICEANLVKRGKALEIASKFMHGVYITIAVDLDRCDSHQNEGVDLFHPPN